MPIDQSQLRSALARGEPLVLGDGSRPAWTPEDGAPPADRVVRAEDLRAVLLEGDAASDPRGLILQGALVLDTLDIGALIPYAVNFERCRFSGYITMAGSHLKGGLVLNGTAIDGCDNDGDSIAADFALIDGGLFAGAMSSDRFQTTGAVRIISARISGQLVLAGADLRGDPSGVSLKLDGHLIAIPQDDNRFRTTGSVRLHNAHVLGQLALNGADLGADRDGVSLHADAVQVDGGMFAGPLAAHRCETAGSIRLLGARISVQLVLDGARVGASLSGCSLNLDGLHIGGDLHAGPMGGHEFSPEGCVRLPNARIDGQLFLETDPGITGGDRAKTKYYLQGLHVGGFFPRLGPAAQVDLSGSRIQSLHSGNSSATLPGLLSARGWSINDVHGVLIEDRRAAVEWTASAELPASQPLLELAALYERDGKHADARWLRYRAAVLGTQRRPWGSWLLRSIYRWVVGHGYYPLAALLWLALVLGLSWGLAAWQGDTFTTATTAIVRADLDDRLTDQQAGNTHPLPDPVPGRVQAGWWNTTWDVPAFDPFFYALSTTLPVATGATTWTPPDTWVAVALALLRLLAWTLTALFLAGVTGLLRRE